MKCFDFRQCVMCGRLCNTNRYLLNSFCRADDKIYISSIFNHRGEEPPISGKYGICNVFYAHCNMQCVYCQNYQISNNNEPLKQFEMTIDEALEQIKYILDKGVPALGFVTPSHFVPQTIEIVQRLRAQGYYPTIVYNTNAYDSVETLRTLEPYVDVYLPDFKYADNSLAIKYSNTPHYFETALAAIKEMLRQKGDFLFINKNGYAESGLIIRHLVLPNFVDNSIKVLETIANELSPNVYISLMSQYYPTYKAFSYPELSRHITEDEYNKVLQKMEQLGLKNGWIQQYESKDYYRPDFHSTTPFND